MQYQHFLNPAEERYQRPVDMFSELAVEPSVRVNRFILTFKQWALSSKTDEAYTFTVEIEMPCTGGGGVSGGLTHYN